MLPYFRSKLQYVYNREREATLQASLWGEGEERFGNIDYFDGSGNSSASGSSSGEEASTTRRRVMKRIQKIIAACYPWIHAGSEG